MDINKYTFRKVIWRVSVAHMIGWALAGIVAMVFLNYEELYLTYPISAWMKPTDDPIYKWGTLLTLIRGVTVGLFLYPLRRAFFEEKYGYWKLIAIMWGFSVWSTYGPGWGSFDGLLFLKIPASLQLKSYPEAIIHTFVFAGILNLLNRFEHKKWINISAIILMAILLLMGIVGALGYA